MDQDRDIRSEWCEAVYCNFSSHDCVRHAVAFYQEALEQGDQVFARFLACDIARWEARLAGQPEDDAARELVAFAVEWRDAEPGSPNALLAAAAMDKAACCVCDRADILRAMGNPLPLNGNSPRRALFLAADRLVGPLDGPPESTVMKAIFARTKTALMNETFAEGKGTAEGLKKDFAVLTDLVDDHVPAFFSRANHLRRLHGEDPDAVGPEELLGAFEETVRVAAELSGVGDALVGLLEEREPVVRTVDFRSGLPLALRQLQMVEAMLALEEQPRGKGKRSRREGLPRGLRMTLDEMERNRFDRFAL